MLAATLSPSELPPCVPQSWGYPLSSEPLSFRRAEGLSGPPGIQRLEHRIGTWPWAPRVVWGQRLSQPRYSAQFEALMRSWGHAHPQAKPRPPAHSGPGCKWGLGHEWIPSLFPGVLGSHFNSGASVSSSVKWEVRSAPGRVPSATADKLPGPARRGR